MREAAREHISFSVIVASQNRPNWLRRCLTALRQIDYPMFEIVLVADKQSLVSLDCRHIRCIAFEHSNLSAARNLGISHSGGEVCAFIDDDAVPEPMWLRHLESAFRNTDASAVTGFVRGRNGISFQSRLSSIDCEGETHDEHIVEGDLPCVPDIAPGRAVKLVGTNFAVRRSAFEEVGGFDENFRYFLEDSDLSLRLVKQGKRLAIAPLAQVHHGFAPSIRRSQLRAPRDLFDIGRSTAVFLRKHYDQSGHQLWERLERREKLRLHRHLVLGTIEPGEVRIRLRELEDGWTQGFSSRLSTVGKRLATAEFDRFPAQPSGHRVIFSRFLAKRRHLKQRARSIAAEGQRVSVFSFSLTPFRHHVRYVDAGVWMQTGGVYGRSDRDGNLVRWCRFAERVNAEIARVAKSRGIGETADVKWWDQTRS